MKRRKRLPLVLPEMRCDFGCGECCGPVPVTANELAAIKAYTSEHHVFPVINDRGLCVYYQNGRCAVYPVRPRVCQAYGHSRKLPCSRKYDTLVDDEAALQRWVISEGEPIGFLSALVCTSDPLCDTPHDVDRLFRSVIRRAPP